MKKKFSYFSQFCLCKQKEFNLTGYQTSVQYVTSFIVNLNVRIIVGIRMLTCRYRIDRVCVLYERNLYNKRVRVYCISYAYI